jgi:hypothetical protein
MTIFNEVLVWLKANKRGQNYWKRMESAITAIGQEKLAFAEKWRNDAIENAAQIAERYQSPCNPNCADIARDIRSMASNRHSSAPLTGTEK